MNICQFDFQGATPLVIARLAAFAKASARWQNMRPSLSAHAGYPVRRGFSFPAPASLEYWMPRPSAQLRTRRGMTAEEVAHIGILAARMPEV
jgi:hypothetical protein